MTRDRLLAALCGGPIPSKEEIADQQVKEWQERAAKTICDTFARFRLSLGANADGAAMAGQVNGHYELSQASTVLLALWHRQEAEMLADAKSRELANEARSWCLRQLERGQIDKSETPPRLVAYIYAVEKLAEGSFSGLPQDVLNDIVRQRLIEDAKTMMLPPATPQQPDVALTPEAKTILECLAEEHPMTVTQESLANKTRLSVPTVHKNLDYLREKNLIHRPLGERKGDTITTTGLAIIGRS
jgi:hypothetical protein